MVSEPHKSMASNSHIPNNIMQPHLPKLTGKNYHHWRIQMKVLYESQDLRSFVEHGYTELIPVENTTQQQILNDKENKKKDKKTMFFIFQAVDENIFESISTATTSKEAWDILYKTYRVDYIVKIVRLRTLRCEFDNVRMKETESIEEFYIRVIFLLNQMRLNGEVIDDKRVVEKILRSLTRKFEYMVVAIEESKDISDLSLENLLGILESNELRLKQFDTQSFEHAFQTQSNNQNSPTEKQFNQNNHVKGKGRGRPLSQVQCFHTKRYGHTIKFCRERLAE